MGEDEVVQSKIVEVLNEIGCRDLNERFRPLVLGKWTLTQRL